MSRWAFHLPGWRRVGEGSETSQKQEQDFTQKDFPCHKLPNLLAAASPGRCLGAERCWVRSTHTPIQEQHLEEDTVYLAEFMLAIISKLLGLFWGKWFLSVPDVPQGNAELREGEKKSYPGY